MGDVLLCGGVDATVVRGIMEGFVMMRIVSTAWESDPPRASRPFSADRDGFVLGESAWMFVLEERERARAGARGSMARSAATVPPATPTTACAWTRPGEEPARAMALALEEVGTDRPTPSDYLAFHGTSTELNDRVETRAVRLAFGSRAARLPGSSIKSMIGHPQSACGAAGVDGDAPGDARFLRFRRRSTSSDADPECDLDYVANEARNVIRLSTRVCNSHRFRLKNSALVISNES